MRRTSCLLAMPAIVGSIGHSINTGSSDAYVSPKSHWGKLCKLIAPGERRFWKLYRAGPVWRRKFPVTGLFRRNLRNPCYSLNFRVVGILEVWGRREQLQHFGLGLEFHSAGPKSVRLLTSSSRAR